MYRLISLEDTRRRAVYTEGAIGYIAIKALNSRKFSQKPSSGLANLPRVT